MAEKESPVTCLTDADVPKGRRCAVCAQGWKSRVCQNTRALAKATDQQRSKWRAEKTEEEALAAGGGRSRRSSRPESTLLREQARQLEAGSDGEEEDPDKPPAGTTATSREDLEAALQEVADSDLVPLEVKDLVAKMDSFYQAKVYEMKPHHSTHLHEAPTNWCASRDAAGA